MNLSNPFSHNLPFPQYEPVIQKGNEHLVHHMEVFHCESDAEEEMPSYVGPCFAEYRPDKTKVCKRVVAAWAMGAGPFSYPKVLYYRDSRISFTIVKFLLLIYYKEAGLPVGGPKYNRFVMLEVHYNNPELKSGK